MAANRVVVESTGTYWTPIHAVLEGSVGFIVGNAYKIKHTPGNKNDLADADWIAELCLNGMIEPSRIFPKADRDIRRLTRIREGYVNDMTREKNRIHHALDSCGMKLSSVLSDIFGKTGQSILDGLLEGRNIDDILKGINLKGLRRQPRRLKMQSKVASTSHRSSNCGSLEQMAAIQKRIDELRKEIKRESPIAKKI